jgi:TolB-like protein/DNA-binding winged helix-turn-helix (wHTH) protein
MSELEVKIHHTHSFSDFTVDLDRGCLLRQGREVKLRPKVFDALKYLVENNHRLVTKAELIQAIWADSFVTDDSLVQCLVELRRALGDEAQEYLKTVPRRGYIFDAVVTGDSAAGEVVYNELLEGVTVVIEQEDQERTSNDRLSQADRHLLPADSRALWIWRRPARIIMVCALLLAGLGLGLRYFRVSDQPRAAASVTQVRSIAVLPFKSVGGQERDEAWELGITDALITRLSNLAEINIRPSSAVFKYAGQNLDPVQAGRELKVDAILDGSIQRQGEGVRISVQLVNVAGTSLWADKFDAKVTGFFATQDSLSEQIARALTLHLTGREQNTLATRHTASAEAYQLCLKGRYWLAKNRPEDFQKAIGYFNQAVAIDPNYAQAYTGLADSYSLQVTASLVSPGEGLVKAKAAADKAVQLDGNSAASHISLAHLRHLTWDWAEAEKEFLRVVELNPRYPAAHLWYAHFLSSLGRHQEAFAIIKKAQEQTPLSIIINECAESVHFFARQYDEAIALGLKNLELEPERVESVCWMGLAFEQKGLYDEALASNLKELLLRGAKPEDLEALRAAYSASGWRGYWRKRIERAQEAAKHRYVSPFNFAQMYARTGDKERAFEFLEKAYAERSSELTLLKVHPVFDSLRSDSRYTGLMRRVGFPD